MSRFKQYRRKQIADLRPVNDDDIRIFGLEGTIPAGDMRQVSISDEDRRNGSPKVGDMIARNPKNHKDQWLVAKDYFNDNFEEM